MNFKSPGTLIPIIAVMALLLIVPAATIFYESSGGDSCARCHEIQQDRDNWQVLTHRSVTCQGCHGGLLTSDVDFHLANARRVISHLRGRVPGRVRIRNADVARLIEQCRSCHQQEFADWKASAHSTTYERIFLDKEHNRKELLIDDCLRCHGMYYGGAIRDLVTPINIKGPWKLTDSALASQAAIPCMACHQMHRQGQPLPPLGAAVSRAAARTSPAAAQEISRPSLALFNRREMMHGSLRTLPLPTMREGERLVRMSTDARQGLCYQCHAPEPTFQVQSGDDRTCIGVHEGLSCLACHLKHGQKTRASCSTCHPRLSNCGRDVETMDTTFKSPKSAHNIHFVKCADCHTKGVPKKRKQDGSGWTSRASSE